MKALHCLAVAGLCATLFTACKKGDDDPSPQERLTSGKWRMTEWTTSYTVAPLPTQTNKSFDAQNACTKDNLFLFGTDGVLRYEEGATSCNPAAPASGTAGNWQLLDNGTKFSLTLATSSLSLPSLPGFTLPDKVTVNGDVLELSVSALRIKGTTAVSVANPLTGTPVSVPIEISQAYAKQ